MVRLRLKRVADVFFGHSVKGLLTFSAVHLVLHFEKGKLAKMANSPGTSKYTAEIRRTQTGPSNGSNAQPAYSDDSASARHKEVLDAIRRLENRISACMTPGEVAANIPANPMVAEANGDSQQPSPLSTDESRMTELMQELHSLRYSIENTRREIAELRNTGKEGTTPLITAGDELDAVVQATETATEGILAAAEQIDDVVGRMRNQATGDDDTTAIDEIGEQIIKIFESCNFQDITGQRITKVVNAMKFVEEKVDRMIDNLGGSEQIDAMAIEQKSQNEVAEDDESHLLEGPQLDEAKKVSQDDIDKLFG
jgi:chemotaxis protein CheZ